MSADTNTDTTPIDSGLASPYDGPDELVVNTLTAGAGAPPPLVPGSIMGGLEPSSTGDSRPPGDMLVEDTRPHRKIGIIGYTTSREEAPYDNPSWELWGMNNLHKHADIAAHEARFSRWYNLHDLADLSKPEKDGGDPQHLAWLQAEHPFPIFLMDPLEGVVMTPDGDPVPPLAVRTGFPSAVPFPKTQILSQFMRYFTNTVSWEIAHAIFEGLHDDSYLFTDLALYGIDMAIGTEYAAQRPSVEYFLGLVQGLGVELHLPASSDLLKAAELYGGEDTNSGLRAKVQTRLRELHEQKQNIENQMEQGARIHASICGAIDSFAYIQGVWVPPAPGADSRDKVLVPAGSVSPVAQMIAEGEARDRHKKEGT